MAEVEPEVVASLRAQYEALTPLFSYLKARLKYDTVRWIRTVGARDDIVFSTRVKSFERIYDKLVRKLDRLPRNLNLMEQILHGDGLLDDVVGLRFVCFDQHQIVRLVSHFITTERVSMRRPEYYIWSRSDPDAPLYTFLRANGFKEQRKTGREYEDVNFIMRFAHPIDRYFRSGSDNYTLYQEIDRQAGASTRLSNLNSTFNQLQDTRGDLIDHIPRFPIECQIDTVTQHLYNRLQRPLYEHVIQAKDISPDDIKREADALGSDLTLLKIQLTAVDHSARDIYRKYGVRYEFIPEMTPNRVYDLHGRLPPDLLGLNTEMVRLNDDVISKISKPDISNHQRTVALNDLLAALTAIDGAIEARADKQGDILRQRLADLTEFAELDAKSVMFWAYQRLTLMFIANVLLYGNDTKVSAKLVRRLNDVSGGSADADMAMEIRLGNESIAITRIFERLVHYDSAVARALEAPEAFCQPAGLDPRIFSDPLIPWRYATLMYKEREYLAAKDKMRLGLELWDRLDARTVPFKIPPKELFAKRIIDYEICVEIARLQPGVMTIPAVLDVCRSISMQAEMWISELVPVRDGVEDPVEQARALCLQILLRLCTMSAQGIGVQPGVRLALGDLAQKFDTMARRLVNNDQVQSRSWWLLSVAATSEIDWDGPLNQFEMNLRPVSRHPQEWRQFEAVCAMLIRLWRTESAAGTPRFAEGVLEKMLTELEALRGQQAIAVEIRALIVVVSEALEEARIGHVLTSTKRENWRRKLKERAVETGEKLVVESIVASVRGVLGF